MIRAARFIDVPALVALLQAQHPRTIYAPYGDVDVDYARKLLAQMVQRHGGVHNGGTCVFVAENREGVIDAFVAGGLSPVYQVGTRLMAQDVFWIAREGADMQSAFGVLKAYVEWAESCPKVIEIFLSHLDVTPESAMLGRLYRRMGFDPCGAAYRRFVNLPTQQSEAA